MDIVKRGIFQYNCDGMAQKSKGKTAEVKNEQDGLKAIWREVCARQKGLMVMMLVLVVMSVILLMLTLFNLNVQNMQVIVGYSDVHGGYQKGGWTSMMAFAMLAVVCGFLHNILTLKVFRKYGRDSAMVVVAATMLLVLGAFVVLFRVLGARG